MKLLKTLKETDLIPQKIWQRVLTQCNYRETARAVVFDDTMKVAIQFLSKRGFYKLPGGGIEIGESPEEALRREIWEEVGCEIEIFREIGMTTEYRDQSGLLQHSYCFVAKVLGRKGRPTYTPKELDQGCVIIWLELDEAIRTLQETRTKYYSSAFTHARDVEFLLETKRLLKPKQRREQI